MLPMLPMMQLNRILRGVVLPVAVMAGAVFTPLRAAVSPTSATPEVASDDRDRTEVLSLLRSRYVEPSAVTDAKIGSASLDAILKDLSGGALLMMQPSQASTSRSMNLELLPGKIGYWRAASFKPSRDWASVEAQLLDWQKNGSIGLVLDLRDFETTNDYAGAARLASLFVASGETLFSIQGLQIPQQVYRSANSSARQSSDLPLVILTNRRTMGAAEALTAVLHQQAKAILVGRSTAGQAASFSEWKLSSGRYLRLATGQTTLADGTALYGKPITPDIALYIDDRSERLALEESSQAGSAAALVQELTSRARTSEAALVHGENPELDELLAQQLTFKEGAAKSSDNLQDVALIRAMDVLRSIQFAMTQSQNRDLMTSKK